MKVRGELSIQCADDLHRLFTESIGRDVDLVLDLSEVQTCDTAALQLICSLRKTAVRRGRGFRIAALSPAIELTVSALGMQCEE